jgi:DNA-binding CsgD family transcriptional regulator
LLSAGRTADAERAAREAAVCADRIRLPLATANSELTDAYVAVDAGDFNEAAKLAQSALATFEALDDVYTATLTRVLVGRALAGAGEQDGAVAQLERAAATFEGWGADRYRDDVERDLRKLGRHIHRRTQRGDGDDGIASLTKRELDVARLVSEGKSNPEIAAELFLSPKTVESHIRNMFRKLSVTSRVEVALAVNRTEATERR